MTKLAKEGQWECLVAFLDLRREPLTLMESMPGGNAAQRCALRYPVHHGQHDQIIARPINLTGEKEAQVLGKATKNTLKENCKEIRCVR